MTPFFSRTYEINSFLVNNQQRLGLYALLNLIQDVAWLHATDLGHGFAIIEEQEAFWVLTRQNLKMKSWPSWGRSIEVRTWVRPFVGPVALRDFEILLDGEKIGECTTSWLLLDIKNRRPLMDISHIKHIPTRADGVLTLDAPKLKTLSQLEEVATFQVRNSDIDGHDHVNNTRYAQWALDAIPSEWHRLYNLQEYAINFIAEVKKEDSITILRGTEGDENSSSFALNFQGLRKTDGKTVFLSRLTANR